MTNQNDIDAARQGLLPTHPRAHEVITALWVEVQMRRGVKLPVPRGEADSVTLQDVISEFRAREQLGRGKYGTDVDRTDFTHGQWLQHLREELMDAVLYLKAVERTRPSTEILETGRLNFLINTNVKVARVNVQGIEGFVVRGENGIWLTRLCDNPREAIDNAIAKRREYRER